MIDARNIEETGAFSDPTFDAVDRAMRQEGILNEFRLQQRLAEMERVVNLMMIIINGSCCTEGSKGQYFKHQIADIYKILSTLDRLREEDAADFYSHRAPLYPPDD